MTVTLEQQAADWQQKNEDLETEIAALVSQKDQLEYLLSMHEARCSSLRVASQFNQNRNDLFSVSGNRNLNEVPRSVNMKQVSNANIRSEASQSLRRPNESDYNADVDEDLSSGISFKQEPEDLSMKPDNKMQHFPANLIINPITSASLITNNNTHYYVSQYTSIGNTVGSSSRLCPSITTSAAKFDRPLLGDVPYKQTLSPRSNFAHDNRETRSDPSPTMIVTPPKRPMHNHQHMSSPRYSPAHGARVQQVEKTPPQQHSIQSPGRPAVPLLCDSPRAMQKQSQYQLVQYNKINESPVRSLQGMSSPAMLRGPGSDNRLVANFGNDTDSSSNSVMMLDDGNALINEFFEDDAAKHFSAL